MTLHLLGRCQATDPYPWLLCFFLKMHAEHLLHAWSDITQHSEASAVSKACILAAAATHFIAWSTKVCRHQITWPPAWL